MVCFGPIWNIWTNLGYSKGLFKKIWKLQMFHIPFVYLLLHVTIVIRTDSLETRTELDVLCTYVENQAILEPILPYRASKRKQTKEQGSKYCLWTHIFTFL